MQTDLKYIHYIYINMFLLILIHIVHGNIWDNMFGNHLAPIVILPSDFHVQLGTQRYDSPYVVDVNYSASLKGARMLVSSSMFN